MPLLLVMPHGYWPTSLPEMHAMSSAMLRPLCRFIHTGIFQAKEYRRLPDDGHARLLLLCLLIHPHGGTFHLPGLYHVGHETLREAASMPRRSFAKGLADLVAAQLVELDQENRLFWFPAALRLVGPPGNPNVAKGYARSFGQLPRSELVAKAVEAYRIHLQAFGQAFLEPFAKAFERVSEGIKKPEQHLQQPLVKASDNSNKNKDNHFHHNSNNEARVDAHSFLEFAGRAGWVGVNKGSVSRLLSQVPSLTMSELEDFSHVIAMRGDVRDPVAYLRAALVHRQTEVNFRSHRLADQDEPAVEPEDGAEMSFDD